MTETDFRERTTESSTPASMGEHLRERADETVDIIKERAEDTFEAGEECVRYNPLLAVFAALIGGFLLGLISVPRERTWRDRYVDEPLERSQAGIMAAALALGALFKRLFDSASRMPHDARKSMRGYSKSAKKLTKRAGKKFRFA